MRFLDQTGNRFGRLVAQCLVSKSPTMWSCVCNCGNKVIVDASNLRSGHTRSCGCQKKEELSKRRFKHGLSHCSEYRTWSEAKRRCTIKVHPAYENYGGRGIRMCATWRKDFRKFYQDMGPRPKGLTLERIDNDGNYEPRNCCWATRSQQNRNQRPRKSSRRMSKAA